MFAHISVGVSNLKKSMIFYDAVMKALGHSRLFGDEHEGFMAYGPKESFFIINTPLDSERGAAHGCNGSHICLRAPSAAAVDSFYGAAIRNGAECAGKPGIREHYSPTYYAAFVYDLDGHKIEAVFS